MADNLGQFKTRVRRYLRETNASSSFWSDDFLRQMFNSHYRRRCSQLISAYEGWFKLIATRDLTADKSLYGLPAGCIRVEKLSLVRSDGRIDPLTRHERHDESVVPASTTGDGYYPTYRPISNGFILEPTPSETVSDGLRIEYAGTPTYLTDDSDFLHPSFPEIHDELLVLDTVLSALEAERIHEIGAPMAIRGMRDDWNFDWDRFIEQRFIARDNIDPAVGPWEDA